MIVYVDFWTYFLQYYSTKVGKGGGGGALLVIYGDLFNSELEVKDK